MYYDYDQLLRDLSLITSVLGERKSEGFFTVSVYSKNTLLIRDGLQGIGTTLVESGMPVDLKTIKMTSFLGEKILKLAIQAEDRRDSWLNFDRYQRNKHF